LSEAAILVIGWAREVSIVENGEIKVGRPLCVKATISVDHRVSDGAEAAQLIQKPSNNTGTSWQSFWEIL
jgi:pyruvate dehydrogenase E2 component (dihydrolipoamide acetyltransferase)